MAKAKKKAVKKSSKSKPSKKRAVKKAAKRHLAVKRSKSAAKKPVAKSIAAPKTGKPAEPAKKSFVESESPRKSLPARSAPPLEIGDGDLDEELGDEELEMDGEMDEEDVQEDLDIDGEEDDVGYLEKSEDLLDDPDDYRNN